MDTEKQKQNFQAYIIQKRIELEFLEYIESLFLTGYTTDEDRINSEIQKYKDDTALHIQNLETEIQNQTARAVAAEDREALLIIERDALKAEIESLK